MKPVAIVMPLLLLLSTGCATIINGTTEDVIVLSKPAGQKVLIDAVEYETPVTVYLSRNSRHVIKFPDGQVIKTGWSSWGNHNVLWNILWNLVGIAPALVAILVDVATGAAKDIEPDILLFDHGKIIDMDNGEIVAQKQNKTE